MQGGRALEGGRRINGDGGRRRRLWAVSSFLPRERSPVGARLRLQPQHLLDELPLHWPLRRAGRPWAGCDQPWLVREWDERRHGRRRRDRGTRKERHTAYWHLGTRKEEAERSRAEPMKGLVDRLVASGESGVVVLAEFLENGLPSSGASVYEYLGLFHTLIGTQSIKSSPEGGNPFFHSCFESHDTRRITALHQTL